MRTPERLSALRVARQTLQMRDQKIAQITQRLESMSSEKGVEVDCDVSGEIEKVIEERFRDGDFAKV